MTEEKKKELEAREFGYGYTIERVSMGSGCWDQAARPWEVEIAASWTPQHERFKTIERAEAEADKRTASAQRYWHARMSR